MNKDLKAIIEDISKVKLMEIPLKDLIISEANLRKLDPAPSIDSLATSIDTVGQTDLIYVVPSQKMPGKYEILKGQRRFHAAKKLHDRGKVVKGLMAIVLPDMPYADQLILTWTEDEHQMKVSATDTSKMIRLLLAEGYSKDQIKQVSGLSEDQFSYQMSLLGVNESETLQELDQENRKDIAQLTSKVESKVNLDSTLSPTGKLEEKYHGLTMLQRSEVMAREKEAPEKPRDDIIDEVKDHWSTSREIGGLYVLISLINGLTELSNKNGTNLRYEAQKFFNEKCKEYLEEKGIKITK